MKLIQKIMDAFNLTQQGLAVSCSSKGKDISDLTYQRKKR